MKILHTLGGLNVRGGGGVTTCTYQLLKALRQRSIDVDVLTPKRPDETLAGEGEPWIKWVDCDCHGPLSISTNLKRYVEASDYDIYHTNGLWMHVNHLTASIARRKDRPYIISPHGMLYPEALRRSYYKKWAMTHIWFGKDIDRAACVHVTCQAEADAVKRFGYEGRIAVIPNITVIPDYTADIFAAKPQLWQQEPRRIGFLGRLHPRKGIDLLIEGLALSRSRGSLRLILMGSGEQTYVDSLKSLVERRGLADSVEFVGFIDGRAKFEALATLSALFVPSDFENFGMIVPEALVVGTPVMASKGTPWEELNTEQCGWWAERDADSVAAIIDNVAAMPQAELMAMGARGRALVMQRYSAEAITGQFINLYSTF